MPFYSKSTGGFYTREKHGDEMPEDVVEITTEEHIKLLDAQSSGKIIKADADGKPIAVDRDPPTTDELATIARRERDRLLAGCDWTQARDVPDAVAAQWQSYRQALRDLTKQADFPEIIEWPVAPC